MPNIVIKFKDGHTEEFRHKGRPGGNYSVHLKLESGFAVIEDEWGTKTIFPSENIERITEEPIRW